MGFVKSYIQLFAYSSVTTDEWKNYLFTYFKDKVRNTWTRYSGQCGASSYSNQCGAFGNLNGPRGFGYADTDMSNSRPADHI